MRQNIPPEIVPAPNIELWMLELSGTSGPIAKIEVTGSVR